MELKKHYHVNLEPKRILFREIGLVIGLLLVFIVFEYSISSTTIDSVLPNMGEKPDQEFGVISKIEDEEKIIKPKPIITTAQTIIEVNKPIEADTTTIIFNTDTIISSNNTNLVFDTYTAAEPFFRLEKMPVFPGGDAALMKFIAQHVEYPQDLIDLGIEGKVTVKYIVDENGQVKKPVIVHSSNPMFNRYALDIASKIPKYIPGLQNGKPASVYISVPIEFKIQKN